MKTKYLLLKPTKVEDRTLKHLEDEADLVELEQREKDLQERRWRKLHRRLMYE